MDWIDRLQGRLLPAIRPILEQLLWYPAVRSFTAERTAVVVTREPQGTTCVLQFGPHQTMRPGIKFTAQIRLVRRHHAGTLELVQDVILFREREPGMATGTSRECKSSDGMRMLDENDPYESKHVSGPQTLAHSIEAEDSPSQSVNPSELTRARDRYRMFLMWRPDRFGGRLRVSLGRIDWRWEGEACAVGPANADCAEGQRGWKLTTSPDSHDSTTWIPTLRRPRLAPNIIDVKSGPWKPS